MEHLETTSHKGGIDKRWHHELATQASGAGLTRRRCSHRDCNCGGSSTLE